MSRYSDVFPLTAGSGDRAEERGRLVAPRLLGAQVSHVTSGSSHHCFRAHARTPARLFEVVSCNSRSSCLLKVIWCFLSLCFTKDLPFISHKQS